MSEAHRKQLERQLWNIADALRSKMNADEYRNYILGFIFFKFLSERMLDFANKQLERAPIKSYTEIPEGTPEGDKYMEVMRKKALKSLGYFLKPSELFSTLVARGTATSVEESEVEYESALEENDTTTLDNFILEDLRDVLRHIENSTQGTDSEKDFINLFEDINLNSTKLGRTVKARNKIIVDVLRNLSKIDFKLDEADADVLGDAYEYLIGEFASGAGKKAGEFYTPQQVSKILARIVTTGKTRLRSVYDPTCGSGSLLLRVAKEATVDDFYGQEQNPTTYNLCRMNMILHDVHFSKFDIHNDDTLENPAPHHKDLRAEAVVANPPFSAHWSQSQVFKTDDRFSQYGKLAPRTKADFAFVQHMIHHLHENGTMACVLPHGALFRGAAEAHIREYLIKDRNYLDAIIGLPANIFYGTSIPTCILVFKKCREEGENLLFIDASQYFEKEKTQNQLSDEHVDKIITTYRDRKSVERYSYVATLEEIQENDYNLNIPRYVDTFEEEAPVDLVE
ncbi:MAG: type I restriction-modification system subunit M, partial [Cyanothece sp. SIO1E1]|nr:type I restriction-modification system subunit M [Cyanothece sp. SIO1E1]